MLVQFIYPVVQSSTVSMSLTQDEIDYFRNLSTDDQAEYILKLNDALLDPEITNKKLIEGALDTGYARLQIINVRPDVGLSTSVNENGLLSTIPSTI